MHFINEINVRHVCKQVNNTIPELHCGVLMTRHIKMLSDNSSTKMQVHLNFALE